ncbi:MAG: hypothetical protein OEU78_03220, partial [Gammaproteobacteria bacterium]|nr:hypothetical protein [Gammaproteobacteria bacterium]
IISKKVTPARIPRDPGPDREKETISRRIADAIVYGRWMAHPHGDDFPAVLGNGIRCRSGRQRRRNIMSPAP